MTTPTELLRQTNRLNDLADEGQDLGYSSLADELREISQAIRAHLERSGEVQEPAVPPGYVLVPIEPTQEMLEDTYGLGQKELSRLWDGMIAAAPTPKEQTE